MSEGYQNLDIDAVAESSDPHAMLLDELAGFVTRHRPCGQFAGDATEPAPEGSMLSVVRACGVTFLRWVTEEDAAHDLGESDLPVEDVKWHHYGTG